MENFYLNTFFHNLVPSSVGICGLSNWKKYVNTSVSGIIFTRFKSDTESPSEGCMKGMCPHLLSSLNILDF